MRKAKKGWHPLKKGALIDVIAPASRCSLEELEAGVKVLESWGYQVRVPKDLFGGHWTHSHNTEVRGRHLVQALQAQDSQAVWCLRGGYGSLKLLPLLQKIKRPPPCKLFLGLSDITSLHIFLNQVWGWPTLHAPVLSRVGKKDLPRNSIAELRKIISGKVSEQVFKLKSRNLVGEPSPLHGALVGGNFVTLMASLATPFQIKTKQKILFLEDIGERAYRLDRLWEQLEQAGLLKDIKAVVFGDLTDGHEPDGSNKIPYFLRERAQEAAFPIYTGLPCGHGPIQRSLALGVNASIRDGKLFLPTGCQK